ncbi:hypothetical protein B0H21DRAFT_699568 [Amylocystis lapponica]|nr:hypothetical protein B0H21DRAFT_699568 [Amylocystis lapponica]
MSKTVEEFTARRVTYETSLPISTVIARLDEELSKTTAGPALFKMLSQIRTRQDLVDGMHEINGGKDFAFFSVISHHNWLRGYTGNPDVPEIHLYQFGNPLVAQTMLQYDLRAGLHVPPRLLVLEKADHSGTQVVWVSPSTLIAVPQNGVAHAQLKEAAEVLDAKVERMVAKVTAV